MADMSDMLKNFASMMDGKEIPDNIKEMLNSLQKRIVHLIQMIKLRKMQMIHPI